MSFVTLGLNSGGDKVVVTVGDKVYGTYDLSKDQTIVVKQNGHTNNITIKSGTVSMEYSDCKNQVCVETGKIHDGTKPIVCLPNKVMVHIENDNGGEIDAVS